MDNEGTSLSAMLNNDEPAVEAPAVEVAPDTPEEPEQQADEQPRGPDGKFLPKQAGVDDAGPPPDKLPPEEYGVVRAIRDENKGLKSELEALRNTVQQLQQPKEPPAPPPSIWEDEQGAFQHFGSQVVGQASLNARLDTSEMLAFQAHADFDAMKERFIQMMTANPALQQQALSSRHPWETAYKIAKNAAQAEELGAVDVADLETKLREKITAELQGSSPVPQEQPGLPPTLTTERNVGARSGPAWAGPPSLSEMLR